MDNRMTARPPLSPDWSPTWTLEAVREHIEELRKDFLVPRTVDFNRGLAVELYGFIQLQAGLECDEVMEVI